jgi:hypothetical chaperone protein
MDFGTTNTGAAWFDGAAIHPLALDPTGPAPNICRSAIYMTRSGDFFLGSTALNTYFEQNVGRPTRYRKIRVGEIIQVFAELPTFYRDVFVYEDEFSPGRLFTSVKTALRNREYYGTAFLGNWYTASDLVAIFLIGMKMQIDEQLGKLAPHNFAGPVTEVVLGRPVHFSFNPEEDRIAQGRLLDAAFKAGFEKVYLEYEPVAAALSYELNLSSRQTVLVFDFGGGTLDFTIMRIGPDGQKQAPQQVLATGGIPIAGDVFDQRLFRAILPAHLGEGDYFLSSGVRYPIPSQIFDTLANPHEILSLNTPQNLEMLRGIHQGALQPEKTHALMEIVSSNYALLAFDLIERAKRQLSTDILAPFVLDGKDFTIKERISRMRFEKAIRQEADQIRHELLATVERSGLQPSEINRVVRTGGSSQIPLFVQMLNEIFGEDKVLAIDAFSSVTAGLAVRGQQIAAGLVDAPAYTPDSTARSTEEVTRESRSREANPANLTLIGKRLKARQEYQDGSTSLPGHFLLFLRGQRILALDATRLADFARSGAPAAALKGGLAAHLSASSRLAIFSAEDHVLLATNRQKLVSAPVIDLYQAGQADPRGISFVLPLEAGEWVAALTGWQPATVEAGYIVMVTHPGRARAFDQHLLAEHIGKRPYFQLERRDTGIPAALFSTPVESLVVAATDQGRAAAAPAQPLSIQPVDLLRVKPDEHLVAAGATLPGEAALALSDQGHWLWLEPEKYVPEGPYTGRGAMLRRSFKPVVFISPGLLTIGAALVGVTSQGRLLNLSKDLAAGGALQPSAMPPALSLHENETLLACLALPR